MKKLHWLPYIFYAALFTYVIISQRTLLSIEHMAEQSYNMVAYMLSSTIIFFILGILLGLEHFFRERSKPGQWKLNWPKIVCLGIPSLLVATMFFLYNYIPDAILQVLFNTGLTPLFFGSTLPSFCQLILGHSVITSFIKENERS